VPSKLLLVTVVLSVDGWFVSVFMPPLVSDGILLPEVCHVIEVLTVKKRERKENSWKKLHAFN
jgi:hypothetical protein